MRLAIGTVQFGLNYGISNTGGIASDEEIRSVLNYACEHGIDTLDTAVAYGNSEERLGRVGIDAFRIVTKLPSIPANHYDDFLWYDNIVKHSANHLKKNKIEGLLLHRPMELLNAGGGRIFYHLQELKKRGRIDKIGISIYEPAELDAILPHFGVDIVQAPFNILDQRLVDTGWLQQLQKNNIELHVRSVFLQGLLLLEPSNRHEKFKKWNRELESYDSYIERSGMSRLAACLAFALSFPEISKVVVGVQNLSQLKEIITASQAVMHTAPDITVFDNRLLNPASWNEN